MITDTVAAGAMVGAVSGAVGEGGPAGGAGQALPEPYVPGSGDRLPAELRLVQAGFVGIAGGAGGLACAAAAVSVYFGDVVQYVVNSGDFIFAVGACIGGLLVVGTGAIVALEAVIKFSRLLRRPTDPRTATVMATRRGGRRLILDILPRDGTRRGHQPLYEVRLALWTKASMLVPGERVKVYVPPGAENLDGQSPVLVSSAQRGRAFLGRVTGRPIGDPGPVGPLDEKVSGTTLVEWAAWAASTTFSSTGLGLGYHRAEVDAFRSAVRDTFLGGAGFWVSTSPVRSDELRGKQFSTQRLRMGYDKTQVDAFLEAAGPRLAAMESTDRPAGPLVSNAVLVAWAEWADSTTFSKGGYTAIEVDAFRREIRDTFLGATKSPVRADDVRGRQFSSTGEDEDGYDKTQVDGFLDAAGIKLAAMESTDTPAEPLVTGSILTYGPSGPTEPTQQDFQPPRWAEWVEWAEWADSTSFSTTPRKGGYDMAQVDAFRQEIRDTFLGVKHPPLTLGEIRDKRFTMARRGYNVLQVDAFVDEAEQRLAGMQPPDRSVDPDGSATDAASTPTDGDIEGWTPPPWSSDAADTRPFWRRIRAVLLIFAAFVLVGAVVGWYLYASQSATGEPEVAPAQPTQVDTRVATPDEIDESDYLNRDFVINMDDSVDLRVGDCFDLKHPFDEIENVKKVRCTAEHEYELFYVGAMGKRSHPTEDAFLDNVGEYCEPAFSAYIGKAYEDSDLDYDWLVPTEDAWRSGDRTVRCAGYDSNFYVRKGSVRGTRE